MKNTYTFSSPLTSFVRLVSSLDHVVAGYQQNKNTLEFTSYRDNKHSLENKICSLQIHSFL